MHVTVLVPPIHDLRTGGNVYNRRMVEALRPETPAEIVSWAPDEAAEPELDTTEESVLVVDSLLARRAGALRTVRSAHPNLTTVLLVHYLRCIDPTAEDPEVAEAERRALEAVDGALATSRFVQRALVEEGLPAARVQVVPPGLDQRYRGPLPVRLGSSTPRMLTVANLVPEKGLGAFVEVLRALRSTSWTWTLVGDASLDPEYATDVLARICEAGLWDRVTYTGAVSPDALPVLYDRANLFVLPSRFETRSLSMREAMARGVPVVGYRVGGVGENLGEAPAGYLVPSGDRRALGSALRTLLTDPLARRDRGRAAWRQSQTFTTWGEAADRFREGLETLRARTATE